MDGLTSEVSSPVERVSMKEERGGVMVLNQPCAGPCDGPANKGKVVDDFWGEVSARFSKSLLVDFDGDSGNWMVLVMGASFFEGEGLAGVTLKRVSRA